MPDRAYRRSRSRTPRHGSCRPSSASVQMPWSPSRSACRRSSCRCRRPQADPSMSRREAPCRTAVRRRSRSAWDSKARDSDTGFVMGVLRYVSIAIQTSSVRSLRRCGSSAVLPRFSSEDYSAATDRIGRSCWSSPPFSSHPCLHPHRRDDLPRLRDPVERAVVESGERQEPRLAEMQRDRRPVDIAPGIR